MKRVLVTGANGFVGGHLCEELLRHGYEVVGFARASDNVGARAVEILEGDVLLQETVIEGVRRVKPNYIVHLAAQAKPGYSFGHAQETFEINVFGTLNVLEAVRQLREKDAEYNPRILCIGTSEEYGDVTKKDLPLREDAPLRPTNPYAISKVACYHSAMQYVRTYGMNILYAVPFSHIGPGQREGFLIPDVCKQIVEIERGEREPVLVTGPLLTKRDYTDVRDIVRAYRMLLEVGEIGERYNLGRGESVAVDGVVEILLEMSEVKISHVVDESRKRPTELMDLCASTEKIHTLCGWKSEIELRNTLRDALDGWRKLNGYPV
ncbi:MAG: GDP-mannose 4,6-dehydratase [Patescibacteria group bacterium]|nr:MAG: GDP-mannose 4,6-dehydratase [Patescibacteria group bacterium]